jgi:hypothetical protein
MFLERQGVDPTELTCISIGRKSMIGPRGIVTTTDHVRMLRDRSMMKKKYGTRYLSGV